MTNFLLLVQTGLLSDAGSKTAKRYNKKFKGIDAFSCSQYVAAMEDAIRLESLCVSSSPTISTDAKSFVAWAILGTEYAWIKNKLGPRAERLY